jgi:nucleoside-diphosphate-sugar epimerase
MINDGPIVITGAAGLVGQNLIALLKARGRRQIVGIDKHRANTRTLSRLHPDIRVIEDDLAHPGAWEDAFLGAQALVLNHAQIDGIDPQAFADNTITATRNVLVAAKRHNVPYMICISSAKVRIGAHDLYTESKAGQERLAADSGIPCCVLRPSVMFGWFDRKHWGWFARFMARYHFCPIPGHGRYLRQPLYVRDFCEIITSCIDRPRPGEVYDISGQETVSYIDLMRAVRDFVGARALVIPIPFHAVWLLLRVVEVFTSNPPFTTQQLEALVSPDVSEVIDWQAIFAVRPTPLPQALCETFQHPVYSKVVLEF